ncbi:hypothetical protein MTR_7g062930 [Medicago truncatula]|nr:hypothetical protein MTR_7g062930 [Medicago truncatula]
MTENLHMRKETMTSSSRKERVTVNPTKICISNDI